MMNMNSSYNIAMAMVLHGGSKESIIFPGWRTEYPGDFFGSCIALFLLSVCYEALKCYRDYLANFTINNQRVKAATEATSTTASTQRFKLEGEDPLKIYWHTSYFKRISTLQHVVQTVLHMLQFSLGYFLMLAFMLANYWVCLSIIIGIGVGYFFFGLRRLGQSADCYH